jgi:hypothetical protein
MITIFSIPKSFSGQSAIHQANAISSWLKLPASVQVILFGNDSGVASFCSEHGCLHLPQIAVNEFGTPLLNDAFAQARRHALYETLCYFNADIILSGNFVQAIKGLDGKDVLGVARRLNVDYNDPIDFSNPSWESAFLEYVRLHATMGNAGQADCFVFKKSGFLPELPPFAVGRPGWDHWMIQTARQSGVPVVDMSPTALLIHPNHGYAHVKQATGKKWEGPEGDSNYKFLRTATGEHYTIDDATHVLKNGEIRLAVDYHHLRVRFGRILQKAPAIRSALRLIKKLAGLR